MNIAVTGAGYVGLSNAILLAQHNNVTIIDILERKVALINAGKSPIVDREIQEYLASERLNLTATTDSAFAYTEAEYVVVATPTNYDAECGYFDTSSVEQVIKQVREINPNTAIIIKSTVPVGYTEKLRKKYGTDNIVFSPEFLREGKALYDCLYPSRIIVGDDTDQAKAFARLLAEGALKESIDVLFMKSTEAEAVKLFANTYLALRVAFFNELDTYAEIENLDTKSIVDGICKDARIGDYYNNPSFGYGGYCLPKDTKQLLANYSGIPQNLIKAVVDANNTRKEHIANMILKQNPNKVGIYRLAMKSESDNYRQSAILEIIDKLKAKDIEMTIYEPGIKDKELFGCLVINDIELFKKQSDVIIANRKDKALDDVKGKVYSRDLYSRD